jgi:hypothetical protein
MKNLIILFLVIVSFQAFADGTKKKVTTKAKPKATVEKPIVEVVTPKPSEGETVKTQVSEPSKLRKDFEATTGIVLGEYYIGPKADEGCQDGRLAIVDYGDELGLILGAKSIVVGIGKDKLEETYENCKLTIKSSYSGNTVEENSEEDCEGEDPHTTKTVMTIEKDKISYTKTISNSDKLSEEFKCVVTLKEPKK